MGMGISRSKPESPLRKIDVEQFMPVMRWIQDRMEKIGWRVTKGVFDPEAAKWYFYEVDMLVLRLEHDTVERLWDILRKPTVHTDHEADVNDYLAKLKEIEAQERGEHYR